MFRSKSPESKDSKNKSLDILSKDKSSYNDNTTIPINLSKLESICYKKCIYTLNTPELSYAEKNCLDRCSHKFKESIDYGHHLLLYINHKVRDSNKTHAGV